MPKQNAVQQLVLPDLNRVERCSFRDQLREARATAARNAEDFEPLLFAIERLGWFLSAGKADALGRQKKYVKLLAADSPLCNGETEPKHLIPFGRLFELVCDARNEALHQGAFARHLTTHATELAIVLEDALMSRNDAESPPLDLVRDFMVASPVCAMMWQPLKHIRQTMLANAFSYLPVLSGETWMLVSDRHLAKYLRGARDKDERKERLRQPLRDVLQDVALEEPLAVAPEAVVTKVFDAKANGLPALVFPNGDNKGPDAPIGIVTPFDVL